MLCSGLPAETAPLRIADRLRVEPVVAAALANEARDIICAAAGFDLTEATGQALTRLNRLYETARTNGDIRATLGCLKEISKLCALHLPPRIEAEPVAPRNRVEEAVELHLRRLGLLPEGAPPEELVRVAAQVIIDAVPIQEGDMMN